VLCGNSCSCYVGTLTVIHNYDIDTKGILIYPNPAYDNITVSGNLKFRLELFDMKGIKV